MKSFLTFQFFLFLITSVAFSAERAPLTILFSSNTLGEVNPCGCGTGLLGGLARRAKLIETERKKGPVLLFDVGDTFFVSNELPKHMVTEAQAKASRITRVYQNLRYNGIVLGEIDSLLRRSDRDLLPIISEPTVIERDGWKVGVIPGNRPAKEIRNAVSKLRKQTDLVVVLFHGSRKERQGLKNIVGIDMILLGHTGELLRNPAPLGKALAFEAGTRGEYLGRIRLQQKTKSTFTKNQFERFQTEEQLNYLAEELRPHWAKAQGQRWALVYPDDPQLIVDLEEMTHQMAELKKKLLKMGRLPSHWFSYDPVPLGEGVGEDPSINKILKSD